MIPVKEPSHRKVFTLIRAQGSASGARLAKQTGMQPSSLVYIINNLKEKGLIRLSGHGKSTARGGKRPVLWEINPMYGYILGVEVMRSAIRAVLVNLAGDVILKAEKDFTPGTPDNIVLRIQHIISEIIKESGLPVEKILYISLAVSGIVNPKTHNVVYSYGLKLKDFDIKSRIIDVFGIQTGVINDANAGALGDQWYTGCDLSINNSFYLSYNPMVGGLGLGIVINRKLYTGTNGLAGEFSLRIPALHQIINGKMHTVDVQKTLLPINDNHNSIQISDVYNYAKKGCVLSNDVLSLLCKHVAAEISKMIGLFDPDRITLGGDLSICENMCCDEIHIHLKSHLKKDYPFDIKLPRIDYARSKVFAVAMGATALYLSDLDHVL